MDATTGVFLCTTPAGSRGNGLRTRLKPGTLRTKQECDSWVLGFWRSLGSYPTVFFRFLVSFRPDLEMGKLIRGHIENLHEARSVDY